MTPISTEERIWRYSHERKDCNEKVWFNLTEFVLFFHWQNSQEVYSLLISCDDYSCSLDEDFLLFKGWIEESFD